MSQVGRYRVITQAEFDRISRDHLDWLVNHEKGTRANLSGTDLSHIKIPFDTDLRSAEMSGANLSGLRIGRVNFDGANLYKADFSGTKSVDVQEEDIHNPNGLRPSITRFALANLREANFEYATMKESNFGGAILSDAKFYSADLQDANFKDCRRLIASQFQGANLAGATLPECISKFDALETAREACKTAKRLLVSVLLVCGYSCLTASTVTDVDLVTNTLSSPLPFVGSQIPIDLFFFASSWFILGLFVVFHLYLQRYWENIASMPAFFPDGRPLHRILDPWLLNGLIHKYFRLFPEGHMPLARLQHGATLFLAWMVAPLTLAWFWAITVDRRSLSFTLSLALALFLCAYMAVRQFILTRNTLRGEPGKPIISADKRLCSAIPIGVMMILALVSLGLTRGTRPGLGPRMTTILPQISMTLGYDPFANLVEADLSIKPPDWSGDESEVPFVEGARLRNANMQYCSALRAFLVNADLRLANLSGADLQLVDFRSARLDSARLDRAILTFADLTNANMNYASLRQANLGSACLDRSRLRSADLSKANLKNASLYDADLTNARLTGATLTGANLHLADIRFADLRQTIGLSVNQIRLATHDSTTLLPAKFQKP